MFVLILCSSEDIRDELKLNANVSALLSKAKKTFSGDDYEVKSEVSVVVVVVVVVHLKAF